MRLYLLLLSAFSLLIASQSCKSYTPAGTSISSSASTVVENTYFSSPETDYLYRTQIEIYGNNLSGILIIKKISDDIHRVAMTTDFGNKMLDFEISETAFKINYLIPDLDRKVVKNILEKDFRALLKESYDVTEVSEDAAFKIFATENPKGKNFLFYGKKDGLLKKTVITQNGKEKVNFLFDGKSAIFADSITLIHKDFRLKIKLNHIKPESE